MCTDDALDLFEFHTGGHKGKLGKTMVWATVGPCMYNQIVKGSRVGFNLSRDVRRSPLYGIHPFTPMVE